MVGNDLDNKDSNFKLGMKSPEKLIIALNVLACGESF